MTAIRIGLKNKRTDGFEPSLNHVQKTIILTEIIGQTCWLRPQHRSQFRRPRQRARKLIRWHYHRSCVRNLKGT